MRRVHELELCRRDMFGDMVVTCANPGGRGCGAQAYQTQNIIAITSIPYTVVVEGGCIVGGDGKAESEKRRASALLDELLVDIHNTLNAGTTDYNSTSGKSHRSVWAEVVDLHEKDAAELTSIAECLRGHVTRIGSVLVRQLKRRDALRRQQEAYCDVIGRQLAKRSQSEASMRFSVAPPPPTINSPDGGESGFAQWAAAMKMVAQLPGGIPPEFRRRLWLTLAERHLAARGVDWSSVERTCFSEWSQPTDGELGVQIVKDLHRTGCSLFCGERGQENQALLKRVLLAYARWNKAVGYCQGFNMLAALMLQVTERSEGDALKLMVYLIEGVLPESYFADSLRGLSVDMAVFRELLRGRLPRLAAHLDALQSAARDGSRSYEPPLTNVFTMQWFLTLFCNCLPHATVLRVWDLILLEGDEILLRAALAIWKALAPRVARARTADEFYCAMGTLTRDLLAGDLLEANELVRAIVEIGPLVELATLREHYLYNIHPWGAAAVPRPAASAAADRQLRQLHPRHAALALDIGALKKQYAKLRQRQRQARVIFGAAVARQVAAPAAASAAVVPINHLLLGRSALAPARRQPGPPKGSIPPARQSIPSTLHWKDAQKPQSPSSSSSSDTELCDEEDEPSSAEDEKPEISISEPTDNPPQNGDSVLMINDNTTSAETAGDNQTGVACDSKMESDSDGESFDFEQFLADRVKCLNNQQEEETDESSRISYARRNSAKALQIIQENSLILHRILQCQSRLSPSPPPVFGDAIEERSNDPSPLVEKECFRIEMDKMQDVHTWINNSSVDEETQSPQYGSKYTSILEKSKSLDERYNTLILNSAALLSSETYPEKKEDKFTLSDLGEEVEKIKSSYGIVTQGTKETEELKEPTNLETASCSFQNIKEIDKAIMETSDFLSRFNMKEETTKSTDNNLEQPTENYNWRYLLEEKIGESNSGECAVDSNIQTREDTNSFVSDFACANDSLDRLKFSDSRTEHIFKIDESDSAISITSNVNPNGSDVKTVISSFSSLGDQNHKNLFLDLDTRTSYSYVLPKTSSSPIDRTNRSPFSKLSPSMRNLSPEGRSPIVEDPSKSPNKIFNPFPVPLSSRQSKEVPYKLGLYKK